MNSTPLIILHQFGLLLVWAFQRASMSSLSLAIRLKAELRQIWRTGAERREIRGRTAVKLWIYDRTIRVRVRFSVIIPTEEFDASVVWLAWHLNPGYSVASFFLFFITKVMSFDLLKKTSCVYYITFSQTTYSSTQKLYQKWQRPNFIIFFLQWRNTKK